MVCADIQQSDEKFRTRDQSRARKRLGTVLACQPVAGATRDGYTEPTEAAWQLLEEAVEDYLVDLKRRAEIGLTDAAETICRGIVAGLYKAKDSSSDGPLGWAPDFPIEEAGHAIAELLRASSGGTRDAIRVRLLEAIAADAPDWIETLERAADDAD